VRSLLLKLSGLDEEAERAVRVIGSFDELVAHNGTIEALVRTAAALAECPAGFGQPGRQAIRFDQFGRRIGFDVPPDCHASDVVVGETTVGRAWLERDGETGPFDEIILERMVIAAASIVVRQSARTGYAAPDPTAVEVILDPRASAPDIARASRALYLDSHQPVRVVAVTADDRLEDEAAITLRQLRPGLPGTWTTIGEVAVMLVSEVPRTASLDSGSRRVGIGCDRRLGHVHESLDAALTALRFASQEDPVIWFDDLGARRLLAEIPAEAARAERDVAAIADLSTGPSDLNDFIVLQAICRAATLRAAASVLHLHHSSVSHRLRQIEHKLGYSVTSPEGRFRAQLAIELWRLQHTRPLD
jgi:hypothetical protein